MGACSIQCSNQCMNCGEIFFNLWLMFFFRWWLCWLISYWRHRLLNARLWLTGSSLIACHRILLGKYVLFINGSTGIIACIWQLFYSDVFEFCCSESYFQVLNLNKLQTSMGYVQYYQMCNWHIFVIVKKCNLLLIILIHHLW